MVAGPPDDAGPDRIAEECWDELRREQVRSGISLRKLASALRREFPRDAPAHATLHLWLNGRKSLPDKLLFLALVRLLDLDQQHWTTRWEAWDRARLRPFRSTDPAPAEEAGKRRRPSFRFVTAVAATVVTVSAIGAAAVAVSSGASSTASTRTVCATVVANRAEVFREPGGAEMPVVKRRGDQVTLDAGTTATVGPDGRRYLQVRTPSRTLSGYSYMLADAVAADC
jgi:hypothetical protein